jgi:hypothetical protein
MVSAAVIPCGPCNIHGKQGMCWYHAMGSPALPMVSLQKLTKAHRKCPWCRARTKLVGAFGLCSIHGTQGMCWYHAMGPLAIPVVSLKLTEAHFMCTSQVSMVGRANINQLAPWSCHRYVDTTHCWVPTVKMLRTTVMLSPCGYHPWMVPTLKSLGPWSCHRHVETAHGWVPTVKCLGPWSCHRHVDTIRGWYQ